MKVSIGNLKKNAQDIETLALAYKNSYNKLSEAYKSPKEMALYTYDYFLHKVKKFVAENENLSNSRTFVVSLDDI